MSFLSLNEALKAYKLSFAPYPKFGMDIYRDDLKIEGVAILEKNVKLQKNIPLKFNFYALLLCIEGELIRHINQYEYLIPKHSLQLVPPNTIYSFENITENTQVYILLFTEDYIQSNQCKHLSPTIEELFTLHVNNLQPTFLSLSLFTRVLNLFEDINTELHEQEEDYHSIVRLLILKLLFLYKRGKQNNVTCISRAQQLCNHYLDLIEKNFSQYQKVSEYAKVLEITPKHLGETVKETLRRSALSYIHERLLKESLYLLTYTNLSICQIASSLGFENPSAFTRFFKAHYKMTPKGFRLDIQLIS